MLQLDERLARDGEAGLCPTDRYLVLCCLKIFVTRLTGAEIGSNGVSFSLKIITVDSQSTEMVNTDYLLNCTPKDGGVVPIKDPDISTKCVFVFPELGKETLYLTDSWSELQMKLAHM